MDKLSDDSITPPVDTASRRFWLPDRMLVALLALVAIAAWIAVAVVHDVARPFEGFQTLFHRDWYSLLFTNLACVPAGIGMFRAIRSGWVRSHMGRAVLLLGMSVFCVAAGTTLYFWITDCGTWGHTACLGYAPGGHPFPSPADIGYLAGYVCGGLGLLALARALGMTTHTVRAALPGLVLTLAVATVALMPVGTLGSVHVGGDIARITGTGTQRVAVVTTYLLLDALMIWLSATLLVLSRRTAGGRVNLPVSVICVGYITQIVADMAWFAWLADGANRAVEMTYVLFYVLGPLLLASGVMVLGRLPLSIAAPAPFVEGGEDWDRVAQAMVESQGMLLGQAAYDIAASVPGLRVQGSTVSVSDARDPEGAVRALVERFVRGTGQVGETVIGRAAREALDEDADSRVVAFARGLSDESGDARRLALGARMPGLRLSLLLEAQLLLLAVLSVLVLVPQPGTVTPTPGLVLFELGVAAVLAALVFRARRGTRRYALALHLAPTMMLIAGGVAVAQTGGIRSDLTLFLTIPSFWEALYGTTRRMATQFVLLAALLTVSIAVTYIDNQSVHIVRGLMSITVTVSVACTIHLLVRRLREQTDESIRSSAALGDLLGEIERTRADERHRVAGEIHDFSLQQLIAAGMHLKRAERRMERDDHAAAAEAISESGGLLTRSVHALRQTIRGLEPASLYNTDLVAAIQSMAIDIGRAYNVDIQVLVDTSLQLPLQEQLVVYRLVSEATTNAARHAQATQVTVSLRRTRAGLVVEVRDNGRGFDPGANHAEHVHAAAGVRTDDLAVETSRGGMGLRLAEEQVRQLRGELTIDSEPGRGTTFRFVVPG